MKNDARDADLWELARLTYYLHDLSKIRPEFQFKKPFNGGYHGKKRFTNCVKFYLKSGQNALSHESGCMVKLISTI